MIVSPFQRRALTLAVACTPAAVVAHAQAQPRGIVLLVGPLPASIESQLRAELATSALDLVPGRADEARPAELARAGAVAAVTVEVGALALSFPESPTGERVALGRDGRRAAIRTSEILRARVALTKRPTAPPTAPAAAAPAAPAATEPPPASTAMTGAPTIAFAPDPTFRSRASAAPPPSRPGPPVLPRVPAAPAKPLAVAEPPRAPPAPPAAPVAPTVAVAPPAAVVRATRTPPPLAPATPRRVPRFTLDAGLAMGVSPGGFGPSAEGAACARWLSRFGVGLALRARLPIAGARADAAAGSANARVTFVGATLEAARATASGRWSYGGGAGLGYGHVKLEGSGTAPGFSADARTLDVALPFAAARLARRLGTGWHVGIEALVAVASPTPAAAIDSVEAARWGAPWVDAALVLGGAW